MSKTIEVEERQFLAVKSSTSFTNPPAFCTPFVLPSGGVIIFNGSYTTTLRDDVEFRQPCVPNTTIIDPGPSGNTTVVGLRDPFYASTSPQIFAIATATVISYLLVILIFITPRTFFIGGPGGGSGFLGRRGRVRGSYGGNSVIGVGRRPWLQKIATITVAVSLTIATADTFRVAEDQYNLGYIDSGRLTDDVVESLEIRVVRLISDTFLWLAQVQTLIRLFPRHKEKVTIKWLGFAMVSLDTIFSILNDFVDQTTQTKPRTYKDAIPALSYLFELAISLIYASCVIYYSLSKRRFAFYHAKMKNVCLVATLSLMAVLTPVVFFVLDISNPDVATWGDYIRWVGAAAASVVVWEWVERIEALERDERKDGILGREIFDGDEMLDDGPSDEVDWPGRREYWERHGQTGNNRDEARGSHLSQPRALRSRIPFAKKFSMKPHNPTSAAPQPSVDTNPTMQPAAPAQVGTPISRSDTTSAASTVYAVRYHPAASPSPAIPEDVAVQHAEPELENVPKEMSNLSTSTVDDSDETKVASQDSQNESAVSRPDRPQDLPLWRTVPNPFKRKRTSPPAEVTGAQLGSGSARRSPVDISIGLRSRFGRLAGSRKHPLGTRTVNGATPPMGVTVIPAQRRGHRTWSPDGNEIQEETEPEIRQNESETAPRTNDDTHAPALLSPSPFPRPRDDGMSITIIPAPRRGQRTWSPDDLRHDEPGHPLQTLSPPSRGTHSASAASLPQSQSPDENRQSSPSRMVLSTRGSLRFSEHARRLTPLRTVSEYETAPPDSHDPQSAGAPRSSAGSLREAVRPESGTQFQREPALTTPAESPSSRQSGVWRRENQDEFTTLDNATGQT